MAEDKASPGVSNHETYRVTGCESACGVGVGSAPLWSSTSQSCLPGPRPPRISPQKVMDILSLAAWPLVILFHRPAPRWSPHNGGRSASSQSILRQTWSSKLVSFGKGLTEDLFSTLQESIKSSEQHVSFFFVPSLLFLATVCTTPSRVRAPVCVSEQTAGAPGGDQRLTRRMVSV